METFTLKILQDAIAAIPPVLKWRACVCKPEHADQLRKQFEEPSDLKCNGHRIYGMGLYPKKQIADAWMFSDEKILRKYLNSELTELDLLALALTGQTQAKLL